MCHAVCISFIYIIYICVCVCWFQFHQRGHCFFSLQDISNSFLPRTDLANGPECGTEFSSVIPSRFFKALSPRIDWHKMQIASWCIDCILVGLNSTEMKMSSIWRKYYWLHWKLSFWQLWYSDTKIDLPTWYYDMNCFVYSSFFFLAECTPCEGSKYEIRNCKGSLDRQCMRKYQSFSILPHNCTW